MRTLTLFLLLAALAVPALVQEQRGAIEGVIKDSSGAVLPGVTVEARNLAVGSIVSTVTSETGVYRFPALQPGTYQVVAQLQGFNPGQIDGVLVALGEIKTVNVTLSVGAVTETVQVRGEAPLVDVRQSARATSIRNEQIDLLPRGRDFSSLGVPYPKAKRQYDSVEFTYNKLLSNNWSLRASYMWSRLWGNYSGLSQSDENGRTSPNVGRVFDYPLMMFDETGQPVYGLLATDRPHQLKAQALYVFDFGTSIGANFYVASGLPVTREIGVHPPNNLPVQYKGRLSDGRTPTFSQTDIYVQHEFRFANGRRLQVSLNVLNLFNQKTAIGRNSTYHDSNGIVPDEDDVYAGRASFDRYIAEQGVLQNPLFLKDDAFQRQLEGRFGVKFIF
ncbi:MAG: carboxypeptidase-like regulatory domain-containing protein [Acidobacteriota bacterium]